MPSGHTQSGGKTRSLRVGAQAVWCQGWQRGWGARGHEQQSQGEPSLRRDAQSAVNSASESAAARADRDKLSLRGHSVCPSLWPCRL